MESLFQEVLPEAIDISTDYIGNVVLQKLYEKGSDQNRVQLLNVLGPHLAAIGIHKNGIYFARNTNVLGTWAVQKIIDLIRTSNQISILVSSLTPLVPALLLDQFGNYVVQCCLHVGSHRNQFIFDAITAKCLDIAQGRFGARAMRACLESKHASKNQLKMVAAAIVSSAAKLCTHPNGALLITWLLG